MTTLKTASVLAFERNLDVSDAFLWQMDSANPQKEVSPVRVRNKSVRGTISNRLKSAIANDPAKLDAEIEKPNLQTVEVTALDADRNTLVVNWSCKVLPFTGKPSACNDPSYQERLIAVVREYLDEHGVTELARRYASNIANGRWLWRNRLGAETIEITVDCKVDGEQKQIVFDSARSLSLVDFKAQDPAHQELAALIEKGMTGDQAVMLNISARADVGYGQEVFPSQELILDTGNTKSKVLYKNNDSDQQAGVHSQKIGNAIRTIDTWYSDDAQFPIAVEPYGAVTTLGTAFRQPKQKRDFYSLFDAWVLNGEKPALDQQHYIMAILIRGGVFGASGKE